MWDGRTSPALGISLSSAGPTVLAGRPVTVAWARLSTPALHSFREKQCLKVWNLTENLLNTSATLKIRGFENFETTCQVVSKSLVWRKNVWQIISAVLHPLFGKFFIYGEAAFLVKLDGVVSSDLSGCALEASDPASAKYFTVISPSLLKTWLMLRNPLFA